MRVKYIVNENAGVVVCIGYHTSLDVAKELGMVSKHPSWDEIVEVAPYLINDEYKGVAKLSEGDTWSMENGKKVAYAKMMKKYLGAKRKLIKQMAEDAQGTYLWLTNICDEMRGEIEEMDKLYKSV